MLTSLPLVQELHHPAMRERHWQQLMSVSSASFARLPPKNSAVGKSMPETLARAECLIAGHC